MLPQTLNPLYIRSFDGIFNIGGVWKGLYKDEGIMKHPDLGLRLGYRVMLVGPQILLPSVRVCLGRPVKASALQRTLIEWL